MGEDAIATKSSSSTRMDQMDKAQQEDLQKFVQGAQQQAGVHAVMDKFTDMCFKKCVARPGTSLGSYESECVQNCVGRFLDSKKFVSERFMQQQQAAQSGQAPPPTPSGGGFFG